MGPTLSDNRARASIIFFRMSVASRGMYYSLMALVGVTTSIYGDAPELAKMVINKVKPEIETSDTIFGFL